MTATATQRADALVVLGTRPELIKMAGTVKALRADTRLTTYVVFTGQHTDLVDGAARCLDLKPDQTIAPLKRDRSLTDLLGHITSVLGRLASHLSPRCVVVQGDTVSALAGALVSELHAIPLIHVEAGVRSHIRDDPFPEETIRRMISPISELHLCFAESGRANLLAEGHIDDQLKVVPHPLIDRLSGERKIRSEAGQPTVLVTIHRRERRTLRLTRILDLVRSVHLASVHWKFVCHPALQGHSLLLDRMAHEGVEILEPLDPDPFLDQLMSSTVVLTDSAGVSEEAELLGIPMVIFRTSAETRLDAPASDKTCVTEDAETAAGFIAAHLSNPSRDYRDVPPVHAGREIAKQIADFALRLESER